MFVFDSEHPAPMIGEHPTPLLGGPDRRGFALVMVLWAAIVLSLLTAGVVGMARTGMRIAGHSTNTAAARATVDGALNLLLLRLTRQDSEPPPRVDGTPFDVTFDRRVVHIAVQDTVGLIDLNAAPAETLRAALTASGLADTDAEALTDKILDWREHTADKRLNGAKSADYRDAGFDYGPREAPFPNVEELKLVMGMTRAVYSRIAPLLTVYARSAAPDQAVAPIDVLSALPGMDSAKVRQVLEARTDAPRVLTGHTLALTAWTPADGGIMVRRTAIVRLTGQPRQPMLVYRWD